MGVDTITGNFQIKLNELLIEEYISDSTGETYAVFNQALSRFEIYHYGILVKTYNY